MPRIGEHRAHPGHHVEPRVVRQSDHPIDGRSGIPHPVERRHGFSLAPREELGVLLLDVRRVGEHHRGEIARGGSAIDRIRVAVRGQERQPAGVVDVGVREHVAVDPAARALEIVTGPGARRYLDDRACALGALTMTSQLVTGDLAGGSSELDFHEDQE